MAVTVRARSENVNVASSLAVTEPAGAAQGDMLVALAALAKGNSLAVPAGWTTLFSGSSTTSFDFVVCVISRGSSAPSLTWGGSNAVYHEIYCVCLKGGIGGTTVYVDQQSASGTTGNGATNPDPPVVNAGRSTLVLAGGINWSGSAAGGWTVSAGYTAQTSNAAGQDLFIESKVVGAGFENPAILGNVGLVSNDFWNGFAVSFRDGSPFPVKSYRPRPFAPGLPR